MTGIVSGVCEGWCTAHNKDTASRKTHVSKLQVTAQPLQSNLYVS